MKPVWLVLPDPFSSRLFFDTGIVADLRGRLGDRLELFLLDTSEHEVAWSERAGDARVTRGPELSVTQTSPRTGRRSATPTSGSTERWASTHSRCGRA